ncbi:hypothetical protein BB8028_0001g02400 [Beauveria bassiana]|uniref:Protein stn1 n=2 Tax=Beauveria bassiana TaxID=176275 RepID=A0A0A2VFB2_BEABA|nr:Protein stn1 [Beauveria bassiana D1-5]PQK08161.1 hypothetical protein BB8028_0001g02400 [Beauveria bassiana]
MSDRLGVVFYPRYCFHLAPTAKGWCFLRVKDLFTLEQPDGFEGEGFYFHRNLPIKWVRIVGVIVAIDDFAGLRAMTIDDSSGACIEVITSSAIPALCPDGIEPAEATTGPPAQPNAPYDYVDVGSVVDVKGALTTFRDVKQLRVEKMAAIRGTAEEMRLWAKRSAFRTDVLEKPWVVPDKTLRKCRREAERSEAEMERKKKRLKAAAYMQKGDETNRRQGAVEERRSKPSREGVEVLKALASSKGGYNALGL